jgi:hypothetical protein
LCCAVFREKSTSQQAVTLMPPPKKLQVLVALFFWAMLLSYVWMAPRLYERMARGYADFSNFYTAGRIVQSGQGSRLYDLKLQTEIQSEFSEGAALRNRALPYMRPPFEALLFLPLSYLPYPRAYSVWVFCSMLLVGVTAGFLRSRVPGFGAIPWWVYYPAYFSFYPIAYGFVLGQDSPLMLFLFGLVMVQWMAGRKFRAGCFLGLALIKFQLVLPLIFILFLKKQFRTLAGFASVAAVLAGVSVWVVNWREMTTYPVYLWQLNEKGAVAGIYPSVMPSLRGLVQGWTNPLHPLPVLDLITGVFALALLVWAARQWQTTVPPSSKTYMAGVAVVFLSTLLAGYHEFSYDLSLLLPLVLLAAQTGLRDGELSATTRWTLVLAAAVLSYPPFFVFLHARAQLNLVALPLLWLTWGFSRFVRARRVEEATSLASAVLH